jgi:drug/metabolite transporter (DMT)-like permease
MTVPLPQSPGAGREESGALWAYAAMLAAMLISSGNFLVANLAVQEIDPVTLAFWRNAIATACFAPFVVRARRNLMAYFRPQKVRLLALAVVGVILPAWFMYLSLRSDDLINLSVGYIFIPLTTILLSALLLSERLAPIQYLGLAAAFLGALVFAFQGDLENLASFDPHEAFLWMLAVCVTRSLYLVLLKRWDVHPAPSEGLFVLLALGTVILIPAFLAEEIASRAPLDYSWPVWGSIAFIGIGMGALYFHLITLGTDRIGATRASLFTYTVPLLVTIQSMVFLGSRPQAYQGMGALFIVGGVFLVSWFREREPHPSEVHH